MPRKRQMPLLGTLVLTAGLLAGCTNLEPSKPVDMAKYALTVNVSADDTGAGLEQRYNGTITVFHPEAGFAILEVNDLPSGTDPAVRALDTNQMSVKAPEMTFTAKNPLSPKTVNNGAWSAWGGGWSAWGGGWSAWGGGWSAWGGGTASLPVLPGENRFAWSQIRLGAAQAISKNFGAGAKVAVIDSGVDTAHPIFSGRLAPSAEWQDYVDGDSNPQDVAATSGSNSGYGHGTAVAGIILQVAPKATILPIRVLAPDGSGNELNVVAGIDWAILKGAQIINLSLGATTDNAALEAEIDYATSRGVYVVVSAGNNGSTSSLTFPAQRAKTAPNSKFLISVGSVKDTGLLSSFSNSGSALETAAPGENIYTAVPGSKVSYASGTSFAAPQISGLLAMMMMDVPAANRSSLDVPLLTDLGGGYYLPDAAFVMQRLSGFTAKPALLVVGSSTLNAGDSTILTRLNWLGYAVTVKTGAATTAADATGKTVVVVSSTVNPSDVNTKFRTSTVPVLTWEEGIYGSMGMTTGSVSGTDYGNLDATPTQTSVNIIGGLHPLTAGLTSAQTWQVFSTAGSLTWAKPGINAIKIATLVSDPSKAVIYAYDKGVQMPGLIAPARRVGFMFRDTSSANASQYWTSSFLFDTAVTWAVTGN
jgi:Subtilase family